MSNVLQSKTAANCNEDMFLIYISTYLHIEETLNTSVYNMQHKGNIFILFYILPSLCIPETLYTSRIIQF